MCNLVLIPNRPPEEQLSVRRTQNRLPKQLGNGVKYHSCLRAVGNPQSNSSPSVSLHVIFKILYHAFNLVSTDIKLLFVRKKYNTVLNTMIIFEKCLEIWPRTISSMGLVTTFLCLAIFSVKNQLLESTVNKNSTYTIFIFYDIFSNGG